MYVQLFEDDHYMVYVHLCLHGWMSNSLMNNEGIYQKRCYWIHLVFFDYLNENVF